MSKKLLFNFNREVIQDYTYVKYVGTIITATNTLEKPIKSAILKGSTKYRDIDTGEVLDAFEDGRNLELASVKMPVLTTSDTAFIDNKVALKIDATSNPSGQIAINTVNGYKIQLNNPSSVADVGFNGDYLITGKDTYFSCDYNDKIYACEVIYEQHAISYSNVWGFFVSETGFQVHQTIRSIVSKTAGWLETSNPVFEYNQKNHVLFVNDFENKTKSIFLNGVRIAHKERVSFAAGDFEKKTITFLQNITGKIYKFTLYNQPLTDEEIIAIFKYEDKTNKTNILTVNEPIELRGIGEVKDELNLLTGEVTERIGEVVFDGSEDWKQWWHLSKTVGFMLTIGVSGSNRTNSIANSLTFGNINGGGDANDIEGYNFSGDKILIRLNKTKLNGEFTDYSDEQLVAFKNYLSQNPITIQYQLATESIKTVDLSVLDQDGNKVSSISSYNNTTHITTSSETISPIFEGYIATKEGE